MQINKKSVIPLYYQLADSLRERISNKTLKPGDPLPSESDLIQEFKLSRGTVRQAFQILTQEGLIDRHRGRGTFVSFPKIDHNEGIEIGSFTQAIKEAGKTPSARVIEAKVCPAPKIVQEKLQLSPNENVVIIKRLRLADNLPLAIEEEYFLKELSEKLLDEDLSSSIYSMLKEKYKYVFGKFNATIEVSYVDNDRAKLLDIENKSPVFKITRIVYLSDNRPFEFAVDTYCVDRIRFKIKKEYDGDNKSSFQAVPNVKSNKVDIPHLELLS